ncbi:TIM barrel protein [Wukongibacter baidiensis]|uniref:sugar phosphate isomerase/epimerase family protein n=1 Tax=Wukongibacter baidiensis TaxID=1723361 RepID=UPI003D7F4D19
MTSFYQQLSISTMYNWKRRLKGATGKMLLDELIGLGFNTFELNYQITKEMLADIESYLERGKINISSIHNVFPHVEGKTFDTDSLLLGYPDEKLRKQAVELTKTSVDYAHRYAAKAVVIHPSEIPNPEGLFYDKLLKELYNQGLKGSSKYNKLFEEMMDHRKKERAKYCDLIVKSVEEVCDYIEKKGYDVVLAIENRAMCHQIPTFDDMNYIYKKLNDAPLYFWLDIGHGIAMKNLGMFDDFEGIRAIKDKIYGAHIHDTIGVVDHWVPYTKGDQIDLYLDIIKEIPIKVIEVDDKNSHEDIIKGIKILNYKLYGGEVL